MLMLSIIGAVARFERELILERQKDGTALAKKAGAYKGHKQPLSASQAADLPRRLKAGEHKVDLAREFEFDRSTVYRYVTRERQKRAQRRQAQ
jgi:DNA invertase Pin-like site-specific DNA recombinase